MPLPGVKIPTMRSPHHREHARVGVSETRTEVESDSCTSHHCARTSTHRSGLGVLLLPWLPLVAYDHTQRELEVKRRVIFFLECCRGESRAKTTRHCSDRRDHADAAIQSVGASPIRHRREPICRGGRGVPQIPACSESEGSEVNLIAWLARKVFGWFDWVGG